MGSKGGSQTTSSQTQTDMGPWSAQAPYLTKLFSEAKGLYNKGPAEYYPDSTVSPFTQAQNQGLQQTIGMGSTVNPLLGAQNQTAQDTISGKYLDPNTNPYLANTYGQAADAVTRSYQTATAPGTSAAYSAAGHYGSGARNQSVDQNNRALGTSLDNLATNIYGGNYQQERQNQLNATNNTGSYIANNYLPATATTNAGGAQQAQQQKELQDLVSRFNFNQQSPWQNLQQYQGAISGNYGQSGTTSGTQTQPVSSNGLGSILGGAASGASMLGNLFGASGAFPGALSSLAAFLPFSDVRLKTDIERVGKTNDGQNLYSYKYIWGGPPQIGLMAQEVEQRDPGAVVEDPSGFKRVNYGRALANAR